jgi:hypothetical protein
MSNLTPRIDRLQTNYIINGNFDFWQRGTSGTITVNDTSLYVADRFLLRFEGTQTAGTITYSRVAGPGNESEYAARVVQTAGSSASVAQYHLRQNIEKSTSSNFIFSAFTVSFKYRSNKLGAHSVSFAPSTGAYTGAITSSKTFTVSQANTWTTYTLNFPALAAGLGVNASNTLGLVFNIGFNSGNSGFTSVSTGEYFELADVVIVNGEFSNLQNRNRRTATEELQLCQRYFQANNKNGNLITTVYSAVTGNFGGLVQRVPFMVSMRIPPIFEIYPDSNSFANPGNVKKNAVSNSNLISVRQSSPDEGYFWNSGCLTAVGDYWSFHWTADAEL